MSGFDIYKGNHEFLYDAPPSLKSPVLEHHGAENIYIPNEGLVQSVNVALALGQPLLVSGAPGCGKTQLAYSIARQFRYGPVRKVSITSTTELADIYYRFDHMAQFRDLQQPETVRPPQNYLRITGLGEALLRAGGPDQLIEHEADNVYRTGSRFDRPVTARDLMPSDFFTVDSGPAASVVLLDEIDKAPRDTPNDMLGWLETMSFEVPELGIRIAPFDRNLNPDIQATRPVIIITTNAEKRLPDAFLRRCAYFHIPFPTRDEVREIIAQRNLPDGAMFDDALGIFFDLNETGTGLVRPPGLAEFIGWMILLTQRLEVNRNKALDPATLQRSLCALIKLDDDMPAAERILAGRLPKARKP